MKKVKYALITITIISLGIIAFNFTRSGLFAATTPSLGAAATYGILANTYTNPAAGTTINGDIGFTVAPTFEPDPVGGHNNYGSGAPYAAAGAAQSNAASVLGAQPCTASFAGAVDLFLDTTHGPAGVYSPGVYCANGAITVTGSLTFNGSGTYIFRSAGALGTTAGITITLIGGASACDIFWTPGGDAALGASTGFKGTIIDNGAITIGANTIWSGRALAFNGVVVSGAGSSVTVPTCTPPPATFHVIKQVTNNSGGSATASSFNMHVKLSGADVNGSPAVGAAAPGTAYSLAAGTYTVSEDYNTAYTPSFSGDCNAGGSVTLASGEDKTCIVTNDDRPASITVNKVVVNNNGGTRTGTDFPLFVSGTPVASGVSSNFPAPGLYSVTETTDPNYTQTFSGDCNSSGSLSLSPDDNKTCTITNNDIPPTLHVIKQVVNTSGGAATAANFNISVKLSGIDVAGSPAAGAAAPGNNYLLDAGTYVVGEDANTGYTQSFSGDCNANGSVVLAIGDDKTCTITNTDIPPTLHVIKTVINDNGGTAVASSAIVHVKRGSVDVAGSPQAGADSPGNSYTLNAGAYGVSEDGVIGYNTTFSGDCDVSGNVTLSPGDNKTCTITNNDIPVPVAAIITNDEVITPVTTTPLVLPFIGVVKVASPSSLPNGPGPVTYTYTLRNDGFVTITDVTIADDSCGPVGYISGDTNANAQLEASEVWTYTCGASVSATHTSTVVVAGRANGVTATDSSSATVVVGSSAALPSINVTNIPNKFALVTWDNWVTYTKEVTNPGTVPLGNIVLTDDICHTDYVSGDVNNNSKLDPAETWVYTCQAILGGTMTSTAIATGEANGQTVRDVAFTTVAMTTVSPHIPDEKWSVWDIAAFLFAALMVLLLFLRLYAIQKKRRAPVTLKGIKVA